MASIRKVADGKYQIRWREPTYDALGKPTGTTRETSETITADSDKQAQKTAQRRKIQIETDLERGITPNSAKDAASKTLGDYAARLFDTKRSRIDDDALAKYERDYRNHIAPGLGSKPVGAIRVSDVESWLAQMLTPRPRRSYVTRGKARTTQSSNDVVLSRQTIKHALGVLKQILDVAYRDEVISSNPARAISIERTTDRRGYTYAGVSSRGKPVRPTPAQVIAISEWIENTKANPVYALAVRFIAFSGIRTRKELQGLEIGDLTLSEHPGTVGSVHIQRSKGRETNWKAQPLKTANADRVIPLDAWLCDELRDYLKHIHQDAHNPTTPLFPARSSTARGFDYSRPIDQDNLRDHYWKPALEALGFPHMVARDMRHMFAIESLRGDHYRDVSSWLGHSKISTTLDIYAANITGEDRAKATPLPRPVAAQIDTADNVVPIERRKG